MVVTCSDCSSIYISQFRRNFESRFKIFSPNLQFLRKKSAELLVLNNHNVPSNSHNLTGIRKYKKGLFLNTLENYEINILFKISPNIVLNEVKTLIEMYFLL